MRRSDQVPDLFATSQHRATIIVFVLGVLGVTTEYRYQTITPTVLQTPSRWAIVTAKMITYALVGILYALVAVAVQLAVAVPWLRRKNIAVDFGERRPCSTSIARLLRRCVALFGIVGLGVGALLRNQIVAVAVGVVFLLVLQNIIAGDPGRPARLALHAQRRDHGDPVHRRQTRRRTAIHLLDPAGGVARPAALGVHPRDPRGRRSP